MALQGGGTWNGVSVLEPDTATLMQTAQAYAGGVPPADYGLGIVLYHDPAGEIVGHSGGDVGVATVWEYYPEAGFGIAMLNNGSRNEDQMALALIREELVRSGERKSTR